MVPSHHLLLLLLAPSLLFSFAHCVCGPPDSSYNDYPVYTQPYYQPMETPDFASLAVSCETTTHDNSEYHDNGDDNAFSNISILYDISGAFIVVGAVVAGCYFIWLHKKKSAEAVAAATDAKYNQNPGHGEKVNTNIGPEKQFTVEVNMHTNTGQAIAPQSV